MNKILVGTQLFVLVVSGKDALYEIKLNKL